ncbi:MAG: hypothetical protein LBQ54_01710 [Planctomycetaceae bacterium]|nr:hypothetical protein [Planctomycetaceae bacterium]
MPPAGSGRPLPPCRLTLTAFGSPSVRKRFPLKAEGSMLLHRTSQGAFNSTLVIRGNISPNW